jgi:hypothetical protein
LFEARSLLERDRALPGGSDPPQIVSSPILEPEKRDPAPLPRRRRSDSPEFVRGPCFQHIYLLRLSFVASLS